MYLVTKSSLLFMSISREKGDLLHKLFKGNTAYMTKKKSSDYKKISIRTWSY